MQTNWQMNSSTNPLQPQPQLEYFQNPSQLGYYNINPLTPKSGHRHQSQFLDPNRGFQPQPVPRKLSGYQSNMMSSPLNKHQQHLDPHYKSDIQPEIRLRKYTDDGIMYKSARTPKGATSGFNMGKFIENFKEGKLANSRKSSECEAGDKEYFTSSERRSTRTSQLGQEIVIPQLPKISKITIEIIDNWGDPQLIGAKAIQFFSQQGEEIKPLHIIPNSKDIYNLINGNIFSKCDKEFWVTPMCKGISLNFVFPRRFGLSMMRIWNYNKSGYTARGVKNIVVLGDGVPIFKGEVRKAEGKLAGYSETAEYILFTESQRVLSSIVEKDWIKDFSFDDLFELEFSPDPPVQEPQVIYPFHGIYNCFSMIRVDIIENYGDPGYTSYEKLRFYNSNGSLIKHKIKTNKEKVMINPPQPIQFQIVEPALVEKIVVKNPQSDSALRKILVTFDTGISYTVYLGSTTTDQAFLLNSSPKYDFECLDIRTPQLQNTLRFGKEVKIILHKNYGAHHIGFNKFQIFDEFNTPMLSSRQIPYYVSQNVAYLQSCPYSSWKSPSSDNFLVPFDESQPVEIILKFESVIIFGAIVLWNKKEGSKLQSVKEMEIRIDDKVAYHGYLNRLGEGGKPHVVLLSCKEAVYNNFKNEMEERTEKETVMYSNEGKLFMSEK